MSQIFMALWFLISLSWPGAGAAAQPVEILYFHRPPMNEHNPGGQPGGFMVDLVRNIFNKAGVPHRFVFMPSKRVLDTIAKGGNVCGEGWFKTPEREQFAIFSKPIYQDQPLVIMANKEAAARLPARPSLEQALKSGLRMGVKSGFAFGKWADEIIRRVKPDLEIVTTTQLNLWSMVAARRFDFILTSREQARWVVKHSHQGPGDLVIVEMSDAPMGNLRYIVYSREVPREIREKIDQVIEKYYPVKK